MYAVKLTNLLDENTERYIPCPYGHTQAYDLMRQEIADMEANDWNEGEDYTIEVVEVDDDFDFESQPDWN